MHNLAPNDAPSHPSFSTLTDPTQRSSLATTTNPDPAIAPSQTSSGQSRRQRAEERERASASSSGPAGGKMERRQRDRSGDQVESGDLADKIVALQRRQAAAAGGAITRTRDPLRKSASTSATGSAPPTRDRDREAREPREPREARERDFRESRDRVDGGRQRQRSEQAEFDRDRFDGGDERYDDDVVRERDGQRQRTSTQSPDMDHLPSSFVGDRRQAPRSGTIRRGGSTPASGSGTGHGQGHGRQLAGSRTWDGTRERGTERERGNDRERERDGGGGGGGGGRGRLDELDDEDEYDRARSPHEQGQVQRSGQAHGWSAADDDGLEGGGENTRSGRGSSGIPRRGGGGTLFDTNTGHRGQAPTARRPDSSQPQARRRAPEHDSDRGDGYGGRGLMRGGGGGDAGIAETTERIKRDVDRLYRPGQQQAQSGSGSNSGAGSRGSHQQHQGSGPGQGHPNPNPNSTRALGPNGSGETTSSQGYQGQGPMRKLFDPTRHDPLNFGRQQAMSIGGVTGTSGGTGTTGSSTATGMYSTRTGGTGGSGIGEQRRGTGRQGSSSLATSISVDGGGGGQHPEKEPASGAVPPPLQSNGRVGKNVSSANGGDLDEDLVADKERERRKRREGSERGSQKKRDDTSRGSRSSEGSESLKDRERGRGKSDTGIMSRLREAYKFIQGLETSLTEMHRKMSADPSNGVRALLSSGMLGQQAQTYANGANAPIFNPAMGQGAIGVLRQAEDDEDEFDRSKPLPTAASRLAKQQAQAQSMATDSDREDEAWVELIAKHKRLSDAHHDFLSLSLDPLIPASLHTLPVRYNIAARLWQVGFHLLLERMRYTWIANAPSNQTGMQHAFSANSRVAGSVSQKDTLMSQRVLEHLTDFIYDAYSFYTNLLEEQVLTNFKTAWIEALGDLARYRMAVASQVAANEVVETGVFGSGQESQARIDDVDAEDNAQPFPSGASIGAEVAQSWNLEERETWRTTARDWYVMGLTEKPGEGRLHHHLALLCRDVKGEEVRGLYHFAKSLSTSHPFQTARESILPLFDNALQKRRAAPEANAPELFVLLHGILFTRIELDTFDAVFDRYMERLEEDARMAADEHGAYGRKPMSQTQWLLMAIVNLSALMQYGAEDGFVRKALAEDSAARKVNKNAQTTVPPAIMLNSSAQASPMEDSISGEAKSSEEDPETPVAGVLHKLTMNDAPRPEDPSSYPLHFQQALKLCFTVFGFCLRRPVRQVGLHVVLNPYITVFLTFLGSAMKQSAVHALLERYIPWSALVDFFNTIPRKIEVRPDVPLKLMGGPPVPEDWCVRGMEWVGRRVYERGFWKTKSGSTGPRGSTGPAEPKSGPRITSEMDVLLGEQDITLGDAVEGVVDDADGQENVDSPGAVTQRRWKRIAWAGASLASCTPGLDFLPDKSRKLVIPVDGQLGGKIQAWTAEEVANAKEDMRKQRNEEEARGEWVVDEAAEEIDRAESDGEESADPELRELAARRRYLRSLMVAATPSLRATPMAKSSTKASTKPKKAATKISVLPGYTVLVSDTNVLLSSLELVQTLTGSRKWTVVVPLPVITELDGLCKQPGDLGLAAVKAVSYLETHIRKSAISLKVQTSKGNYLSDLVVRAEALDRKYESTDLDAETVRAQTMDDFILRVAVFQLTNFNDRSAILGTTMDAAFEEQKRTAPKVMLLTFDRNLRLRARARGIEAADDKEMAKILGSNG